VCIFYDIQILSISRWTQVLNMILADMFQGHPISERKLKELLGHTPSQVFAGALLGILVACFCCQGCIVMG
jgi:acid phosphatase family membrane protein YuiD